MKEKYRSKKEFRKLSGNMQGDVVADNFDKYELYAEGESQYCYPQSYVLKNKLNLRDYDILKEAETEFVTARLLELEIKPIAGLFDKKHLYSIHKYLFQDIYDFAGKTRKEDISKGNTKFCVYLYIDDQLDELFAKLNRQGVNKGSSNEDKIGYLAFAMAELNIIHPFREGNGRSIREFIRVYALHLGFTIDWSRVNRHTMLDAMIESVFDYGDLMQCLSDCIV